MSERICKICNTEKTLSNFRFRKDINYILKICKDCENKKSKQYNSENKIKIKKYQRNYDLENKEQVNITKTKYRKENKDRLNNIRNERRKKIKKENPVFKLSENIRRSIVGSLKKEGHSKKNKTTEILGCSFSEFKTYIENKFEPWMNWQNHGKYNPDIQTWQLDHKIPISSATTEEEIIKLNHHTNFQPLETIENIKKSNKIISF